MDHQKPTILLIFGTLSLGGCGGHPMRPKLNLKDKSQMSTPNEYTDNLKSNLICIFLSVRTKSKKPLCPRTQCKKDLDLRNFLATPKIFLKSRAYCIMFFTLEVHACHFSVHTTFTILSISVVVSQSLSSNSEIHQLGN